MCSEALFLEACGVRVQRLVFSLSKDGSSSLGASLFLGLLSLNEATPAFPISFRGGSFLIAYCTYLPRLSGGRWSETLV